MTWKAEREGVQLVSNLFEHRSQAQHQLWETGGDQDRDSLCLLLTESWKLLATLLAVLSW